MNINSSRQDQRAATKFLRLKQIIERYNISASSIWAMVKSGKFPKPIKLSENCTGWIEGETEEWAQSRISNSRK